ncbi:FkbM family methyltransferase [Synechococcus sp. GFB01]|uniref:FkbM family methyltransferase n=1 Tax=Synechococcus sp. GFB01 TaxID=1662190 RepID=UPI000A6D5CED|nr:FkbM family methyltransferase [Synechococcus sp. GFB01]
MYQQEQIMYQQEQLRKQMYAQKHILDKAASYLEFTQIDVERMISSNKHQNLHRLIKLLSPMDISGARYRRVGRDYDGGYIMLDDFAIRSIDAAYSFGISDDVSWDEDIAGLGIDVFMYDHTIEALPRQHPRFHFFKQGVAGIPSSEGLATLSTLVAENGHQETNNLILKMDIEGHEWSVIEETPSDVLNQFSQIVIEFHGLNPTSTSEDLARIFLALAKINETHQSIHVHANGYCSVSWLCELALPHVIEVTYVRRSDYQGQFIPNKRFFPTNIDQPTFPWLPDVYLGLFAVSDFNAVEDDKRG